VFLFALVCVLASLGIVLILAGKKTHAIFAAAD
jgi:hypothetical protein